MKEQIQSLMREKNISAILISGAREHNPSLGYFVGDAFFTSADVLVGAYGDPILFYRPMERDTAAQTGMKRVCYNELEKRDEWEEKSARAQELLGILTCAGIECGNLALSGRVEFGEAYAALEEIRPFFPDLHILGIEGDDVLHEARFTKDASEIAAIQKMSDVVTTVVGRVESYICSQKLVNGKLTDENGNGITIGQIKSLINLWLGELGAENPEGTIFSMGRDAGVCHSQGDDDAVPEKGKSIVFDFFPCGMGGGYFSDFTRTWCIGEAPQYLKDAYEQVKKLHDQLVEGIVPGMCFKELQRQTCEYFHSLGHQTIMDDPKVTNGYVHSVGHGLGLNIHERPFSGKTAPDTDVLIPGAVFTIEPGIYYPDAEEPFGVRIEDTYYIDENGKPVQLTKYKYQLELNVRG